MLKPTMMMTGAVIGMAVLAACGAPTPTPEPFISPLPVLQTETLAPQPFESPLDPTAAPVSDAARATLSGALVNRMDENPIPGTAFYLTAAKPEAETQGEFVLMLSGPDTEAGDVAGQTDAQGAFRLTNVPPGNYYLVVWAPYNWIPVPESSADERPRVFVVAEGETVDLGRLALPWP
jgi:hypothetical protein